MTTPGQLHRAWSSGSGSGSVTSEGRRLASAALTWAEAHLTRQYTNLNLLVSGLTATVKPTHAKIRRGGYRAVHGPDGVDQVAEVDEPGRGVVLQDSRHR